MGEKGKVPFLKGKVKKTHPLEVRLKLIFGPCRNLQILSQNLFNHCMGDATASLHDCGLYQVKVTNQDAVKFGAKILNGVFISGNFTT